MNRNEFLAHIKYDHTYAIDRMVNNVVWKSAIDMLNENGATCFTYTTSHENQIEFIEFIDGNGFEIIDKWVNDALIAPITYVQVRVAE